MQYSGKIEHKTKQNIYHQIFTGASLQIDSDRREYNRKNDQDYIIHHVPPCSGYRLGTLILCRTGWRFPQFDLVAIGIDHPSELSELRLFRFLVHIAALRPERAQRFGFDQSNRHVKLQITSYQYYRPWQVCRTDQLR